MKIGMKQVREMKWCASGARNFCDKYGIDWSEFRTTGVDHEIMLATNDALAIKLVDKAMENGRR